MAHDVTIDGLRFRVRNPLAVAGLTIVTLGLYGLYWYTAANNDTRMYLRDYSIRPGVSLFALILNLIGTQFIALALILSSPWLALGVVLVIPSFVSVFRTGRRIALMQVHAGVEETSPGIGLVLFLLFFLVGAGIYLQAGLNRVWAAAGSHPEPEPAPEPVGVTMPGGVPSVAAGPRTDARATGNNLVDPHDVGSRVTFQFELPNGYTTEAVGVFERWDEDAQTYFVRKKDGTEVRVPARGVRHGKVIPPAPQPTA